MASDTFRSPHGPCPPSNTQLKRPLRDLASALVDPQVTSDLGDRLPGLEHHLDGFGLELRAEPAPLLWHGQILSAASHCPRSLVHPSACAACWSADKGYAHAHCFDHPGD